MIIPDPIAMPEDEVQVLNYRCTPPVWEKGIVRDIRFSPEHERTDIFGSKYTVHCRWTYTIYVERQGRGGYSLQVGDDGVRKP